MSDSKVLAVSGKRRPPNAGKGRKKGVPNKTTTSVREAIAKLADGHAERFIDWIDAVAATDPKGAAELFLKAIEYHIPKLARSEVTGAEGGPIVIQATDHDEKL